MFETNNKKPHKSNNNQKSSAGVTNWLRENWRTLAFLTYFFICLFDFIIMPALIESSNKAVDGDTAVKLALQFKEASVQIEIIKQLTIKRAWVPLTMGGAAAFHFAFGAILTSAAYTRGKEKLALLNNRIYDNDDAERESIPQASTTPDNPDA